MIETVKQFVALRASDDPVDRERAIKEEASLAVWRDVIADYRDLRVWVVRNETVPSEVLRVLSADPDPEVRAALAVRSLLPAEVQVRLAKDPDYTVRHHLVWHGRTSRRALEILVRDEASDISLKAEVRLERGDYN